MNVPQHHSTLTRARLAGSSVSTFYGRISVLVPAIALAVSILCAAPLPAAYAGNSKKKSGSGSSNASQQPQSRGGGSVRIISPDTDQTFAQFEIVAQRLWWSRASQQLTADITFSNVNYAGRNLRREDEPISFRLPGATLDPSTNLITARASNGSRVVIGRYVSQLLGSSIRFAPYAYVIVYNSHGRVSVELVADSGSAPVDLHWQVRGREMRFRNLLD